MLGLSKVNCLVLSSLLAPAWAASLRGTSASIQISDTRITGTGGVFSDGEMVTGTDIGYGGMIIADADSSFVNDIREMWRTAQGSAAGIYYELQQLQFIVYPDQSKPWPADATFGVYLPPFSST